MADQLTVGGVRLNHVAFLVIPDDRFSDLPQWLYGNLGLDLLCQARAVTLDFKSMTLTLQ